MIGCHADTELAVGMSSVARGTCDVSNRNIKVNHMESSQSLILGKELLKQCFFPLHPY